MTLLRDEKRAGAKILTRDVKHGFGAIVAVNIANSDAVLSLIGGFYFTNAQRDTIRVSVRDEDEPTSFDEFGNTLE